MSGEPRKPATVEKRTNTGVCLPFAFKNAAFVNALAWRVFHSFALGFALRAQSDSKWLVKHFVKNYYYEDVGEGPSSAVGDAFSNFKSCYNLSLCMVYGARPGVPLLRNVI